GAVPDTRCCLIRWRSGKCGVPPCYFTPTFMSEPIRADIPRPGGMVTSLFTDIEGSTALWEQDGARMSQALAAHDAIARRAVENRRGTVVKSTRDGMHAVFEVAQDALEATR